MEIVVGMHIGQGQEGIVVCLEMPEHFPSARRYTDDTRSHRCPGSQLWVWLNRNWSILLEMP